MRDDDVTNVARFDSPHFGANRLSVLQSIYRDQPHLCHVAEEKRNTIGYIMARQACNGFWIGPWVCLNPETARQLFNALVATIERDSTELRVGLPVLNTSGLGLMNKLGFQLADKSIHMVLGNRGNKGAVTHVYGIGGPEKG